MLTKFETDGHGIIILIISGKTSLQNDSNQAC